MRRVAILILGLCCLDSAPSQAFWERSQLQACKEAQTASERERRQCLVFAPVYEWPRPISQDYAARPLRPLPQRLRK